MKRNYVLIAIVVFLMPVFFIVLNKKDTQKQADQAIKEGRSIASLGEGSSENQCHGTPLRTTDARAVMAWMRNNNNRVRSIDDLLCCMPESFRSGYLIAHSSLSAQRSHYNNPRLIFGNIENGIMFSISGGDSNMPQGQNVEVMFDNPMTGQLELFDIEFNEDGRRHSSRPNPSECISCHGSNGRLGEGGPRPVFNLLPWPRMFVDNKDAFLDVCPERAGYLREVQDLTFNAINNNPRFRCLTPPSEANVTDGIIDSALEDRNEERVIREMRASTDFHYYEPLLVGASLGCLGRTNGPMGDVVIPTPLENWLPADQQGVFDQRNFLRPPFNQINPQALPAELVRQSARVDGVHLQEEATFRNLRSELAQGRFPPMPAGVGLGSCSNGEAPTGTPVRQFGEQINNLPSNQGAFIADSLNEQFRRGTPFNPAARQNYLTEGIVRWLFESRGVEASGWNMRPTPGYERSLADSVMRTFLARDYQEIYNRLAEQRGPDEALDRDLLNACRELSERSLRGFRRGQGDSEDSPESTQ